MTARRGNIRRLIYLLVLVGLLFATRYFDGIRRPAGSQDVNTRLSSMELEYTRHARCRMDCRFISEAEVRQALTDGRVDRSRSDPDDRPCPTWAIEDVTGDGQRVRIIFAECDRTVKVVTTIDLENEYDCVCD